MFAVHNLAAHLSEESFFLEWKFFEKQFGNYSTKDSITQVLESFIAQLNTAGMFFSTAAVQKCKFVNGQVVRIKPKQVAE